MNAYLHRLLLLPSCCLALAGPTQGAAPETLPGTAPMAAATGDERSRQMVAGIDLFAMHLIESTARERQERWKHQLGDTSQRAPFLQSMRDKLKACLGMVDERIPNPSLQTLSGDPEDKPIAEGAGWTAHYVRWPVFAGVYGEGVVLRPKGRVLACVICLPDAGESPVQALLNPRLEEPFACARQLAAAGCEVVAPLLLDRHCEASGSERYQIKTNAPHREWIYRQAYVLGRSLPGYETAKVLSLVEAQSRAHPGGPAIGIMGVGEGGWLALYASALEPRLKSVWVGGCFSSRDHVWEEPLDRNLFALLNDFDAAEIGALILPRALQVSTLPLDLAQPPPAPPAKGVRQVAAPAKLDFPSPEQLQSEAARLRELAPPADAAHFRLLAPGSPRQADAEAFAAPLGVLIAPASPEASNAASPPPAVGADWQLDQVRQLQDFTQSRISDCENERNIEFWKKLPLTPLDAYSRHIAGAREHFWRDVIGKLPDPSGPMNARSRLISENEAFTVHEVLLDVWPDVSAWGYLLVPKNIPQGGRRPVVVCQHGLEGLPEDTVAEEEKHPSWHFYKGFAAKLARQGFITFAPHNFYRGTDKFRVVQRKLNLTGKTLFSVIIGQHQRILEYLKSRPDVDASRIGFYGLSYGGKSAMRIPAVLTDYCLSICSGDFNEWVRKCVSVDMPMSYVFAHEYEIWEWNLGRTFNYAEMAALIAPRPFMVERGHNDGVGLDEWVSYEYAKVRRLYDKLGIGGQTEIEYFEGPHTIHGEGTFSFLHKHLRWPAP